MSSTVSAFRKAAGPWLAGACGTPQADRLPFSFRWGEQDAGQFLATATETVVSREEGNRTVNQFTFAGAKGLECGVEMIVNRDFPAVEWVLRFRNKGAADSPILSDVLALDVACAVTDSPTDFWEPAYSPILYRSPGPRERTTDFQFQGEFLGWLRSWKWAGRMTGASGRSSGEWLPFFNLDTRLGHGLIVAVGWTGQWAAEVRRDEKTVVTMRAGMEQTHLTLHPGEAIRTPRILLLKWEGEVIGGQNLLRRLLLKYHTPTYNGRPLDVPACCGTWGGTPTPGHLKLLSLIHEHKLPYDYYWVDAGWYGNSEKPCPDVFTGDSWYKEVGNWRVNPHYHPKGLKPVSDAAHAAGMKFLLWMEPERARHGTPITMEHPEWFLSPAKERREGDNLLLDLGNPKAHAWITDLVSNLIRDNGIDCYRQDFNMPALDFWRRNDSPNRQGISEIRHIEGLYAFWDELRRRHPHLMIDNCAGGGQRIDLETIGRSIPLWRNDYNCFAACDAEVIQSHGAGLTHWVPLHATSPFNKPIGDTYRFRSALAAGIVFNLEEFALQPLDPETYSWDWHRKMLEDFQRARPFWLGDYYPLTTCTPEPGTWLAFQLHREDLKAGCILAFRRTACPFPAADFRLRGLEGVYQFEDTDSGEKWFGSMNLRLEIGTPRTARLLFYQAAR